MIHAAVLFSANKLVVSLLKPNNLRKGQVLVKIYYSGVCRSQLMEVRGLRGADKWFPHLLGHEASGVVVEVGPEVTKVKKGDDVILTWIKGEGLEAEGAKYKCNNQDINSGKVSTFSNYSIVSENRLVLKPKSLPFDTAVLFGCAIPTGVGMVLNEVKPTPESSVVILGLGGIGFSAFIAAKALRVNNLIVVDRSTKKLQSAIEFGATHVLPSEEPDILERVYQLTGGGADYCIESGGTIASIELGFALIRNSGGKLLFASHPPEGDKISLTPHELISGKRIEGSWGGSVVPDRDIPCFYEILNKSRIPIHRIITKRYKLSQINGALEDLENGQVFRPLIVMNHED